MNSTLTKVLIVDDTETNLDILIEALGDDYDISVAMDGERALEIAEEEQPDLMLLDIMMPGMDGYEVTQRIKSNPKTRETAIIFISALQETNQKIQGLSLGAVDYITKPFDIEEVKARVKRFQDGQVELQQRFQFEHPAVDQDNCSWFAHRNNSSQQIQLWLWDCDCSPVVRFAFNVAIDADAQLHVAIAVDVALFLRRVARVEAVLLLL